jgi:hypothetical protein
MSIVSLREILPRTFEHRFGESPRAQTKYSITVTVPITTQQALEAVGIKHGSPHPEYGYLLCVNGSLNEVDRHHVEVVYDFELPPRGSSEFAESPLARPDSWSYSTGGAMVPALFSYAGPSNLLVPLVNSAGDIFEGLTRPEAELRVTISGNRPTFDFALATNITNCVNIDPYLGGAPYTWMCTGISGSPQSEVVNGIEIEYYSFVTELIYRESSHLLFIPNVGWNYLTGASAGASAEDKQPDKTAAPGIAIKTATLPRTSGSGIKKERAFVLDPEDKETKLPSSNPVALNDNGSMKAAGLAPDILVRRVNRAILFGQFFGTPTR